VRVGLAVVLLLSLAGCGSWVPGPLRMGNATLVNPSGIPAAPRDDLTLLAIHRGCELVGFTVQEETEGHVRARIARNEWMIEVDVLYGGPTVSIRYANSNELGYYVARDGRQHIRSSYNGWVTRLADAIAKNARRIAADVDPESQLPPPVAEPAKSRD
jgi:hypothetical protein